MFLCNTESKSKSGPKVTDTFGKISKALPKSVTINVMSKGQVHVQSARRKVNLPTKLQGSYKKPLAGQGRRK